MSKVSMESPSTKGPTFRISGHETFPCRYAWLPKVVRGLRENPKLFSDEAAAMVTLGVGKNMVRSIRFWSQATGMATILPKGAGHANTVVRIEHTPAHAKRLQVLPKHHPSVHVSDPKREAGSRPSGANPPGGLSLPVTQRLVGNTIMLNVVMEGRHPSGS
jgi:hypothetical protein